MFFYFTDNLHFCIGVHDLFADNLHQLVWLALQKYSIKDQAHSDCKFCLIMSLTIQA